MSFLTQKLGPLPAWGWGAAGIGGLLLLRLGTSGQGLQPGPKYPAGRMTAEAEARVTAGQNTGQVSAVTDFGYGPSDSRINMSFFGNGVLDHTGPAAIPFGMPGYQDVFNVPSGAGGVGSHGPRWAGDAPPAGGEGYQNYGQSTGPHRARNHRPIGLNFREPGCGGPHPQRTTMGTPLNTYTSQHGDTMDNVANKMWGPGQNGTLIHQANPGIAHTPNSPIPPGHKLKIPSAPPVGLAPSGVSGNGVGAGSWKQSTRSRITSAGMFDTRPEQDKELETAGATGARPKPGKGGHRNRGGRGIQKGR